MAENGKTATKRKRFRSEFKKQLVGYIVGAFGLIAGLAWNEAIKSLIGYLFPSGQHSLLAQFIYAIAITAVVVIITIHLTRFFIKEED